MRPRLLVVGILALALVLRLGLALLHDAPPLTGDAADFARHARTLADFEQYPVSDIAPSGGATAFRPPGYPIALSLLYEVGFADDGPRAAGALLGTVAVALLGLCALWLFGPRPAVAAMAIAAIFPPLIMVSAATLGETLFIVFVLGSLACALAARREPERLAWIAAAGALAGAASLTRTNGLVLLIPLLFAVPRRRLVVLLAAALVIVPWTIRSSSELDGIVLTTTQPGFTLAGAYNDEAESDDEFPAAWRPPIMDPYDTILRTSRDADEAQLEREFRSEALGFAADHPLYPPRVVYQASVRMLNLADPELERISAREAGVGDGWVTANRWSIWALAVLAAAGAATAAARAAPRWLWLFPLLLWLGVAIAIGATRYRTPVDPFLILLAALAVVRWAPPRSA